MGSLEVIKSLCDKNGTISKKMAETGDYFGLRISGDSMEPLIHHGFIVIARRQDDVENGDIANRTRTST